ncbi:MAG: nitroreductase family protein [Cyanobacteria bacterium P01_A01_bin.37]
MKLSRRNFILIAGSTAVVVAAGKAALDLDKMPAVAIAPWSGPDSAESDIRKRVLSYAILAPNPHNMQPWLVDLKTPDRIDLYCDRTRLLPQTDPFARQILIGHGAFLELLDLAASAEGYRTDITYFPQGEFGDAVDDRPVATIQLIADANRVPDPLFQHIVQRRSAKVPFDMTKPLTPAHAEALATADTSPDCQLTVATDPTRVLGLQGIVQSAMELELRTPRTLQESLNVMRIGAREVAQHRDGIDLTGAGVGWGRLFGVLNREKAADPASQAFKITVDMYRDMAEQTPAFVWMTTTGNSRSMQLAVGRAYAKLNLQATALGVAMHPMSQVLQEYAEMQPLQRGFLSLLNVPEGDTVQMLARLGYAEKPAPSPRRDVQDLLVT